MATKTFQGKPLVAGIIIGLALGGAAISCSQEHVSNTETAQAERTAGQETRNSHTPAIAEHAPESADPGPAAEPSSAEHAVDPMARMDDDMKQVISELGDLGGKPIETLSAAEARRQPTPADAAKAVLEKEGKSTAPEAVRIVVDRTIRGPGGQIPIRVYTPKTGAAPYPVILYFHGGGFVIASNDVYDATPRALANAAQAIVVSVEYRKAPEHKFPAAHEDAFAAYQWTLKNAAELRGDAKRIAVAGESAGGNLAASVSLMARDNGIPLPVHELLIYPVASSNLDAPSYQANEHAKPLNKAMMPWFTDQYFRSPSDARDPRFDLLDANLKGLPDTTIINAEIDPLLSDGEALARRLKDAGVTVEQKTYQGVTHEFFGMGAVVSDAKNAETYAAERLKHSFDAGS